ncbi:hypothetical protein L228DRAFT_179229 [Xylona heveae TC161]|uniref:4Fe-4S ferredoxin-type domain-containing protein n=1 Tax=Xylona heveae (strain CBS 132557 / TC161) TaxID=1328760 RepID=A0A165FB15_XYLHT|nr:hypothetical protein L228DRAFT_179229 [Xylona heveae TC161]KZF20776.1 hypothetical protein L228DRAFT_179229 [Xylona heveae TC161]
MHGVLMHVLFINFWSCIFDDLPSSSCSFSSSLSSLSPVCCSFFPLTSFPPPLQHPQLTAPAALQRLGQSRRLRNCDNKLTPAPRGRYRSPVAAAVERLADTCTRSVACGLCSVRCPLPLPFASLGRRPLPDSDPALYGEKDGEGSGPVRCSAHFPTLYCNCELTLADDPDDTMNHSI